MSAWIISIGAVVALSVLLDIIVPEGETNKYIKGIFSIITIFVIISPILNFVQKDYSLTDFLGITENKIQINKTFVDTTESDKREVRESIMEKILEKKGYKNVTIRIYLDYDNNINNVTANLEKSSIDLKDKHIDIIEDLKSLISDYLNIKQERITIYGKPNKIIAKKSN